MHVTYGFDQLLQLKRPGHTLSYFRGMSEMKVGQLVLVRRLEDPFIARTEEQGTSYA
jgi:hypothetical protein